MKKRWALLAALGLSVLLGTLYVMRAIYMPTGRGGTTVAGGTAPVAPSAAPESVRVAWSPQTFNPTAGERAALRYDLPAAARVTVAVYHHDQFLVRELLRGQERPAGEQAEEWDGRDGDGRIVPNGAYFAVIEATAADRRTLGHDPLTSSQPEFGDIREVRVDHEAGAIRYRLPKPSRVFVRFGMRNGPLLRTLVSWEPRLGGEITEPWDGKDQDGLTEIWNNAALTPVITYVSLPEPSVIAIGNSQLDYATYKRGPAKGRPRKPANEGEQAKILMQDILALHAAKVSLTFPELEGAIPELRGQPLVRVDLDSLDASALIGQQLEVAFFADNVFFAEQYNIFFEKDGYVPLTYPLDLHKVAPGEHVLTVNISTFTASIGVASRRVTISSDEPQS